MKWKKETKLPLRAYDGMENTIEATVLSGVLIGTATDKDPFLPS